MKALRVQFSLEAEIQLDELESYLSERFYPENAARFIDRLIDACVALAKSPQIGVPRDSVRPGIRSISFERKATIYYKVVEDFVLVLAIDYRGRDVQLSRGREPH